MCRTSILVYFTDCFSKVSVQCRFLWKESETSSTRPRFRSRGNRGCTSYMDQICACQYCYSLAASPQGARDAGRPPETHCGLNWALPVSNWLSQASSLRHFVDTPQRLSIDRIIGSDRVGCIRCRSDLGFPCTPRSTWLHITFVDQLFRRSCWSWNMQKITGSRKCVILYGVVPSELL